MEFPLSHYVHIDLYWRDSETDAYQFADTITVPREDRDNRILKGKALGKLDEIRARFFGEGGMLVGRFKLSLEGDPREITPGRIASCGRENLRINMDVLSYVVNEDDADRFISMMV